MLAKLYDVIIGRKIHEIKAIIDNLPASKKPQILIFDDGMQNPYFIKDKIIMAIDGLRGFGNEMLLPAGPLRMEISEALDIVDARILIGQDLHKITAKYKSHKFITANIAAISAHDKKQKYFAFASIGNPSKFFSLLASEGYNVMSKKIFPDHYQYKLYDILSLI